MFNPFESQQDRINKMMCAQQRHRSAWAFAQLDQFTLYTQWVAKDQRFLHADSKDSDQIARMRRLVSLFCGRKGHYFCRTCFSMGNLGVQVSVHWSFCSSVNIYPGCLVSATPLTVLYRSSWNFAGVFLMVCRCACGLDIDYFLSLFPLCELSHFSTSVYRQWVPCEHNCSHNFIPIFLKLCTCFLHGLKMCM